MKVSEVIKHLSREHPDEEVLIIMEDATDQQYVIEAKPFLHGGPQNFHDNNGNHYQSSVVMIRIHKKTHLD